MISKFLSFRLLLIILLSLLFIQDAHAYIDPGIGSYVFQILIVAVLGGAFAIKMFWAKIINFIKKLFVNKK